MAFLSTMASRFPPSNNQLRTSSNPRNQVTIQDGRVIVQQIQGANLGVFAWHWKTKDIATTHGNYGLNNIKEDFGKRFVTKKELDAEQAFWLKHSNHTFDTSFKSHTPVRIEAPSELPKVSLVNESLKKLKYHLASFDKVVKNRTTSDAITAALKNELRKLKGKNIVDYVVSKPIATIASGTIGMPMRCPLTRITSTKEVPLKETTITPVITPSSEHKGSTISDVPSSSLIDCRFGNDNIAKIMGYGDYQMGNVTISQVYYMEGLGHNLFSVGIKGSNLYTLSMEKLMLSSRICLLSKASKTKSWFWHQRLCHLNFNYITSLAKQGIVRGLPKLKYQKDHLCSACALGKSKKHSHKSKAKDSIQEKLYLLHMDLCGLMRI
ncbi:integrase, catalytic region, zinc finger, CCHC-type containing protein [Tanacetum coccineum]